MSCYFVIDTYIDLAKGREEYDEYIELVKPIVEAHKRIPSAGRKILYP